MKKILFAILMILSSSLYGQETIGRYKMDYASKEFTVDASPYPQTRFNPNKMKTKNKKTHSCNYILTAENGIRVIKCLSCGNTNPI